MQLQTVGEVAVTGPVAPARGWQRVPNVPVPSPMRSNTDVGLRVLFTTRVNLKPAEPSELVPEVGLGSKIVFSELTKALKLILLVHEVIIRPIPRR